jgi:hypothetical protein
MDVFELTHKTTGMNGGSVKVDVGVAGRHGREWSMEEACRLIVTRQAVFLYRGQLVTDISVLPEKP